MELGKELPGVRLGVCRGSWGLEWWRDLQCIENARLEIDRSIVEDEDEGEDDEEHRLNCTCDGLDWSTDGANSLIVQHSHGSVLEQSVLSCLVCWLVRSSNVNLLDELTKTTHKSR